MSDFVVLEDIYKAIKSMPERALFKREHLRNVYPYGSIVYGTYSDTSDMDFIVVIDGEVGEEHTLSLPKAEVEQEPGEMITLTPPVDITVYDTKRFKQQIENHEISVIECLCLPAHAPLKSEVAFPWPLDKSKLRESLSAKASNSFVKAKKKFEIERQPYIAKKSLWHALRILKFGIQLATAGHITKWEEANHWWNDIRNNPSTVWDDYKARYQSIYNELKTEFRKVAPLAVGK